VPPMGVIRLAYTAGMLLAFELSRGFHGMTYPVLYDWFMPIRGMRVPARFSFLVGMTLAMLAGFGCVRLFARSRSRITAGLVFVAILGGLVVDLRARLDLVPVWREPPSIYNAVAGRSDVVLAEFPWWSDRPEIAEQLPLMYFSIWHWANMVNGSSGFEPRDYRAFLESIHRFPDAASIAALKARGVTHVTINCALYGSGRDCQGVIETLEASPEFRKVATSRWERDVVSLYELVR
jgi:hypothetical protein